MYHALVSWLTILGSLGQVAETERYRERAEFRVAMLLEDNGDELLPKLTNPTGCPGEGHVEKDDVFSGKTSIRIVPMQRFSPAIPEWKFHITEKPKPGEYRYLRFAWKAPGCSGIMLQLHDLTDWHIRYTAGLDKYGWGTQYVAPKPTEEWTLVTVDLFKDFGERTIRGMALTCFDGDAGFFDHIYFGRTIEDLDRIDATGLSEGPDIELTKAELDSHWANTINPEKAATAYCSFWTLAACPAAAQYLSEKLRALQKTEGIASIKKWISELDHEEFKTREAATKQLAQNVVTARSLLEKELTVTKSPEAKSRIKLLLQQEALDAAPIRIAEKAITLLEVSRQTIARKALSEFAGGDPDDRITQLAKQALARRRD